MSGASTTRLRGIVEGLVYLRRMVNVRYPRALGRGDRVAVPAPSMGVPLLSTAACTTLSLLCDGKAWNPASATWRR